MRAVTGTVLGRRYRLTDPIASGGMGEVWQAHDDLLGRTVAVKVLREELVSEPGFLERFRTEARNTARLAHANIATTYDYGESDGSAWLVMELVPGEPLSDLLAREGSLEPRRAMRLLSRAASGLAAAHAAGIVHRDVKPGNLLVTPDEGVKVTDFGIARAAAEAPLTATGQVMGTAAYLAPEQATGRRDLTPAVDVYALGVLAHEMLAGERPFTGESQVAIALAQVNDPPPPLPRWIPAAARELVALCLAKDPRDRPAQAGVVAEVAGRIADGDDAGAIAVLDHAHGGLDGGPVTGGYDPTVVALPPTNLMPPGGRSAGETGSGSRAGRSGAAGAAGAGGWAGAEATRQVPWPEPSEDAPSTGRTDWDAARSTRTGGSSAGAAGYGEFDRYDDDPRGQRQPSPRQYADESAPPAPQRRRWTFPLLGLVAVLLVILVVLLVNTLNGGASDTPVPGTTASSPSTGSSSASSPSPSSPSASSPSETTPTPSSDTPSQTPTPSDTPSPTPTSASPSTSATAPTSASSAPSASDTPSAPASSASAAPAVASATG